MTMFRALALLTALNIAPARAEPPAAPLTPLATHRAVYDISLLRAAGAMAPINARGRIAFEFSGSACEGYVQNFRQLTELQPAEGAAKISDMRSATYEAGDGADYRFKIETKVDNGRAEETDGKAQKRKAALAVDLSKPKKARLDFAGETLFPTEHLRRIIAAARNGERLLEAKVYDGTGEGDKAFDTLTVIGAVASRAPQEKAAQAEALKNVPRWPVSVSYFESGKKDSAPIYVLSFDLYENGVSRALKLDYGDFVLRGDMTELSFSPTPNCNK
ncbi:MAG: cell envelope integrity EipB family protein [Methylocystis sp.]|nr:cell envelope integrity EipB family protein [Methylocystis sp.]